MAVDMPEAEKSEQPAAKGHLDWLQMGFWLCLLMAVGAASATLAWPNAGGPTGLILLISMAAGGMVMVVLFKPAG